MTRRLLLGIQRSHEPPCFRTADSSIPLARREISTSAASEKNLLVAIELIEDARISADHSGKGIFRV